MYVRNIYVYIHVHHTFIGSWLVQWTDLLTTQVCMHACMRVICMYIYTHIHHTCISRMAQWIDSRRYVCMYVRIIYAYIYTHTHYTCIRSWVPRRHPRFDWSCRYVCMYARNTYVYIHTYITHLLEVDWFSGQIYSPRRYVCMHVCA